MRLNGAQPRFTAMALVAFGMLFLLSPSLTFAQTAPGANDAGAYTIPSEKLAITAAVPRNWPPHYLTDINGNPDGFAIEAMEEIAKIANLKVRYKAYESFTKTMTALEEKQVDIVPNVGIADFRKKFALFTEPVETFLVSAFVRTGSLTKQQLDADWKTALKGRVTAVVVNNVGQRVLSKAPEVPIVVYENVNEALVDLIAGRVDALAYPQAVVLRIVQSIGLSDKITVAGTPLREIKRGVATRNDKAELHQRITFAVDKFVKSKKYEEIYLRWFGNEENFWTTKRLISYVGIPVAVLLVLLVMWRYYSVMRLNQRLVDSRTSLAKLNVELESRVNERTRDLAQQKNLFESVFQGVPDCLLVANLDRKIIMVNNATTKIFGYEPDQLLGGTTSVLYENQEEYERQGRIRYNMTPEELGQPYRLTYARKNGEIFPGETVGVSVQDENNKILGFLGIIRDITEQELVQEQLIQSSKMATLGEMATGIAHELNQPLNVIRMAANNILRKSNREVLDADYLTGKLHKVIRQIERASAIIDQMRIFGRTPDRDKATLDPAKLVKASLGLIGEQLRLVEIDITTDFKDPCSSFLGHQVQVEQVLLNLMSNALDVLKVKEDGKKQISLRVYQSDNGENVLVEVEDNGGGISPEVLPHIFDPFFTTKEIGKGTGLGLSISYGIVRDMGGILEANNTDDGVCFTMVLPAVEQVKVT